MLGRKGVMSFKVLTFLGASLLAAGTAQAEESRTAEVLFQRGQQALDRRDPRAACKDFEESLRLETSVGTYFGLARCNEAQGKVATAWQHQRDGIDHMTSDDPRRLEAVASAVRLERRVPHLRLRLAPGVQNLHVFRDGVEIDDNFVTSDLPLDPGVHELVVLAPDRGTATYRIDLHEAELRILDALPGPTFSAEAKARRLRLLGYGAGAAGGALMVTGLVTGIVASTWSHVVHDHCDASHLCDTRGLDALDRAKTWGSVSTVTWISGGVLAAAGVVLHYLGRHAPVTTAGAASIRF